MRGVFYVSGKVKKTRRDEKKVSPAAKILIGAVLGSVIYFAAVAVFAAFALKSGVGFSSYMPAGLALGALAGLVSGFFTVRPIKQNGALYGALSGLGQSLINSIVLFSVNKASAGTGMLILAVSVTVASAIGGIAAVNIKRKKKY